MNTTEEHILQTLAYFNIFNYPLKNVEIRSFLAEKKEQEIVDQCLQEMVAHQKIFKLSHFYSLQNDMAFVERRIKGNNKAAEEMITAAKAAKILSQFPYVKGLAISGSLSKNFADEKTDIDFFIITNANRLWIARTFMHLFYKFSKITGRQRWFCMNYYVDEAKLEIEEKNIFTAMEIVTLIPMQGNTALNDFYLTNNWALDYFPASENDNRAAEIKDTFLRKVIEKILNNKFGDWLDDKLMNFTNKRWQKKTSKQLRNRRGVIMGMSATKHCSKPNPKNFQKDVLEKHATSVKDLRETKFTDFIPSLVH